jgi:hypothetical protein
MYLHEYIAKLASHTIEWVIPVICSNTPKS